MGQARKQRRRDKHQPNSHPSELPPPSKTFRFPWYVHCGVGAILASILVGATAVSVMAVPKPAPLRIDPQRSASKSLPSLGDLTEMSDERLAVQDLALVNLRCAHG